MSEKSNQYKDTLNLPKTGFAMKANLAQREPARLKHWYEINLYEKIRDKFSGKQQFILHDGPPYANGDIHLGHSVNKILKDIIVKSKTLQGYDAPYVPGWDCHGLPIEHKVEGKVGKPGQKVDHKTFRKKCREYAAKQVEGQKKDFKRLGVLGAWDNPYLTMDYKTEGNIVRALGKIVERGHLVRGFKPVYWSVVGGSALAEAEVEYQDKQSYSIDVGFKVIDSKNLDVDESVLAVAGDIDVLIWTTTPWTLPANQAVSVNPELDYVLVKAEGLLRTIIVAQELLATVAQRLTIEEDKLEILGVIKGASLENILLQHPFYDKQVPVLLGDHVTTEAGTGCVHTAPDHGVDDFNVSRKYGIETLNLLGDNGVFGEATELFAGEHVYKVDDKVVDTLKNNQALYMSSKFSHSYPHCWRTKTPLIFRATPQWFISMSESGQLDKPLLDAVKDVCDEVEWVPNWGRARIDGMLASSPDWCVSRQRTWGVPITLFIHKQTQELHPDSVELFSKIAQRIDQEGIEAWFELDSAELLGADHESYRKASDTLDVWFDSGVTHYSVLAQRDNLRAPADLYLEGSDQHRGWFQSSLKTSMAMTGRPPYKTVLTHGFTVDAEGKKMSKSLGNIIAPQEVMNVMGADVLRLWVAATDFSAEMSVSDEILKRVSDSYRRIRNTARFMLSNLEGFSPDVDLLDSDSLLLLDRWAITRAHFLQQEIIECYNEFNFHQIYQKLHNFCVVDMGGIYLDIIKDRQYTTQSNSVARRSAQTALYHIVHAFSRWIAPILSFTADEIYEHIPMSSSDRQESIHLEELYSSLSNLLDKSSEEDKLMDSISTLKVAINKAIESARSDSVVKASLEAEVVVYASPELMSQYDKLEDELRFALITSQAVVKPVAEAPANALDTEIDGVKVVVEKSSHEKCIRCWHYRIDVGSDGEHPELCTRCVQNVAGSGEARAYA